MLCGGVPPLVQPGGAGAELGPGLAVARVVVGAGRAVPGGGGLGRVGGRHHRQAAVVVAAETLHYKGSVNIAAPGHGGHDAAVAAKTTVRVAQQGWRQKQFLHTLSPTNQYSTNQPTNSTFYEQLVGETGPVVCTAVVLPAVPD